MLTETDLANMALLHLGDATEIEDLATDTTKSGRVMRRLYPNLRRALLSVWDWPFATYFVQAQIQSFWPTPEYGFAWQYPNNCLKFVRVYNGKSTDDISDKVPYGQLGSGNQRLITTNFGPSMLLPQNNLIPTTTPSSFTGTPSPIPVFEYVSDITNFSLMPQLFKDALALYMAAYAAPSLPGIGAVDLREKNLALGGQALQLAGAQNMNERYITPEKRSLIEKAGLGQGICIPLSSLQNYVPANYTP